MFTPCPNEANFNTGKPWSWYIANTASASFNIKGWNKVSAGKGPIICIPCACKRVSAGITTSISSLPKWPFSPAWGFKPATKMRGCAMPNLRCKSSCKIVATWQIKSWLMACGTSFKGKCVVTNATRKPPPTNIITTCSVWLFSAKYSVCPLKNAPPASLIIPLCKGAVTMAANSPRMMPAYAVSNNCNT